jgi:ArsR family transcriptional regulator
MRIAAYMLGRIQCIMIIDADTLVQALADGTRLRALALLGGDDAWLCVCELTAALDVSQPKMSRHLATLRAFGLVDDARIANRVFYRLHPALPAWARGVVDRLAEGLDTRAELVTARQRLDRFPNRPRQRPGFSLAAAAVDGDGGRVGHAV